MKGCSAIWRLRGVEMQFMTMVTEINMEDGAVRSVTTDKGETWYADEVVAAVGREGADWFSHICSGTQH